MGELDMKTISITGALAATEIKSVLPIENGARFWSRCYRSTKDYRPYFSPNRPACLISGTSSSAFVTYCSKYFQGYGREAYAMEYSFYSLNLDWRQWRGRNQYTQEKDSLLVNLPDGDNVCPKCLAVKYWDDSLSHLGIERSRSPISLRTSKEYEQYEPLPADNIYLDALQYIYFEKMLHEIRPSIKRMKRLRYGDKTDRIIKELLDLGVVSLHPDRQQDTIFIQYNNGLDVAVAMEVLSWYKTGSDDV